MTIPDKIIIRCPRFPKINITKNSAWIFGYFNNGKDVASSYLIPHNTCLSWQYHLNASDLVCYEIQWTSYWQSSSKRDRISTWATSFESQSDTQRPSGAGRNIEKHNRTRRVGRVCPIDQPYPTLPGIRNIKPIWVFFSAANPESGCSIKATREETTSSFKKTIGNNRNMDLGR